MFSKSTLAALHAFPVSIKSSMHDLKKLLKTEWRIYIAGSAGDVKEQVPIKLQNILVPSGQNCKL